MTQWAMIGWVLAGLAAGWANAEDWPQFRGPRGTAVANEADPPVELKPGALLFQVAIPGVGVSSPVIVGDQLYVTSAEDEGAKRSLHALDARTGKVRWSRSLTLDRHKKHQKNSFATSTPAADADQVVVTFASPSRFVVRSFDTTGALRWQVDLGGFEGDHGFGASPLLDKGRVFVTNDQDGPSFVVMLDAKTGLERWRSRRENVPQEDGKIGLAAYSTPSLWSQDNGSEVLVLLSAHGLTGLDTATGKQRWVAQPFPMKSRAVGSPVIAGNLVIASRGTGTAGHLLAAVRLDGQGDVTASHVAWTATKVLPYCPSGVAYGEWLFLVTDRGIARALVAATGAELWSQRVGGNVSASPIIAGGRLYIATEDGKVVVLAADKNFRKLSETQLDDHFLATPAAVGKRIYLRGESHLWCFDADRS